MEQALSLFSQILEMYEKDSTIEEISESTGITEYQVQIVLANYYQGSNPTTA